MKGEDLYFCFFDSCGLSTPIYPHSQKQTIWDFCNPMKHNVDVFHKHLNLSIQWNVPFKEVFLVTQYIDAFSE